MCYLKLARAIVCDCMSSICSDVRWMQIHGNAILCYETAWRHCLISSKRYDVSFGTCVELANELHGSCTVETGFSVAPAPVYHQCCQHPQSVYSWSKYSSLWVSVSFEFSRASVPGFFDITGRFGRRVLAFVRIFSQWFALPQPRQVDPFAGHSSMAFV